MTITSEDVAMLMSFVERIADWFAAVFGAEYAGVAVVVAALFFVAFVAVAIWLIFGGKRRRRGARRVISATEYARGHAPGELPQTDEMRHGVANEKFVLRRMIRLRRQFGFKYVDIEPQAFWRMENGEKLIFRPDGIGINADGSGRVIIEIKSVTTRFGFYRVRRRPRRDDVKQCRFMEYAGDGRFVGVILVYEFRGRMAFYAIERGRVISPSAGVIYDNFGGGGGGGGYRHWRRR